MIKQITHIHLKEIMIILIKQKFLRIKNKARLYKTILTLEV